MKKVLVISSSLRKNSNSELLAVSFAEGAKSAGHETEVVTLRNKEIRFCVGCLACQKTQRCFMHAWVLTAGMSPSISTTP